MDPILPSSSEMGDPSIATDAIPTNPTPPKNNSEVNPRIHHISTSQNSEVYNTTPGTNYALLFNHIRYMNDRTPEREGANIDSLRIQCTFKTLGFKLKVFTDLSLNQIIEELKRISDIQDISSLTLLICTHGDDADRLYAYDVEYSFKEDILKLLLSPTSFPNLPGKPKLFFIQACQGDQMDTGVKLLYETDGSFSPNKKENVFTISERADILEMRSSYPNYPSFRSIHEGSVFIKALCNKIDESKANEDLLSILTKVKHEVSMNFEAVNEDYPGAKQVPCVISSLTRKIYLKPLQDQIGIHNKSAPKKKCEIS